MKDEVIPKPRNEWTIDEVTHSTNNKKGLNAIFTSISPKQFEFICTCENSKEAWDILQVTHEGTSVVNKSKLQMISTQFENIKMQD